MKFVDMVLDYFGYSKIEYVSKPEEKPAKSNIQSDDEMYGNYATDYWGSKVKQTLQLDDSDKLRYKELHQMDYEVPELSAALDVNADYIVYPNEQDKSKMIKVTCKNYDVQKKIDEIEERVGIQEQLPPMIRSMLKYGDNAEELVKNLAGNKFLGFRNIPIRTVVPVMTQGYPSKEPRIIQMINEKIVAQFNDDEVFHLCLNTDRERYSKYGKGVSMIEHSRLLYRQLRLMEEGMMITRLSRANQNYAMIVDVGELQGEEALTFLDSYKKRIMRRKYIDPKTGKWSWEYNPLSVIEDIMVPTRQGSGGNVIPLNNSASSAKNIEDVLYCQDKLIYSSGTPKLIIGKEVDVNSKSTSDNQISTFLRRIRRIQTIISPQIKALYQKILKIEGIEVSLSDLEIYFPVNSTVDEERKASIEKIKCEIAKILKGDLGVIDDMYIYTNLLGMTKEEAEVLKSRVEIENEESDSPDTEEDLPETKENLLKFVKNKLSDEQYKEWEKMQKIISKNPILGEMVVELIEILQAEKGN